MFLSIDRFEGTCAVCESDSQKLYVFKKFQLPQNSRPGDVLVLSLDGCLEIDVSETARRKKRVKNLQNKLFNVE